MSVRCTAKKTNVQACPSTTVSSSVACIYAVLLQFKGGFKGAVLSDLLRHQKDRNMCTNDWPFL